MHWYSSLEASGQILIVEAGIDVLFCDLLWICKVSLILLIENSKWWDVASSLQVYDLEIISYYVVVAGQWCVSSCVVGHQMPILVNGTNVLTHVTYIVRVS